MKKSTIIILICVTVITTILIGIFTYVMVFGANNILSFITASDYNSSVDNILPDDRYANREEIEKYISKKYKISKVTCVSEREGRWTFKENNSRGIEFEVIEEKEYDSLFGTGYNYWVTTDYFRRILEDYVQDHNIPHNGTFEEGGGYSFNNTRFFGKAKKITVYYNDENLELVIKELAEYIRDFKEYNDSLNNSDTKLNVEVNFKKENSEYSRDLIVSDRTSESNGEFTLKDFEQKVPSVIRKFDNAK